MDWNYLFRKYTAALRVLPDFLIVGTQKGGTTSLYYYLSQHPDVVSSPRKEINYFNLCANRPIGEYKHYFPLRIEKSLNKRMIAGEATPDYLIYTQVPKFIKRVLPQVKVIILLRNPADRAYSHYAHNLMMKREWLSFEDALDIEEKRIGKNYLDIFSSKNDMIKNFANYSYRERGMYADQIAPFFEVFDSDNILILQSERLFKSPLEVTNECLNFLGLSKLNSINPEPQNQKQVKVEKNPNTYASLKAFYESHNERLFNLIGKKFDW